MPGPGSGVPYLAAHVKEALATDPRTNSLDVSVTVTGDELWLSGEVACEGRRQALAEVTRELLPAGVMLVNHVTVKTFDEPTDEEPVG